MTTFMESTTTAHRIGPRPGLTGRPLEAGTPQEFVRLRELLGEVGFTPAAVHELLGSVPLVGLEKTLDRPWIEPTSAREVLFRLFVEGSTLDRALVERFIPGELLGLFKKLELLQESPSLDALEAPLAFYPTGGLFVVSDHAGIALSRQPPADVVFPAVSSNTVDFLAGLPATPCDALLDLGSGTGVAAMLARIRGARHAWAVDITARATRMAEFNLRLNGIDGVTALEGDLFEPVRGMTFDRIVTHPPYMPASENFVIFRDSGEDGEHLTRRIMAGLPEFLRPGGRCYWRGMATDRVDAPLEQRVRDMLGPANDQFDIALIATLTMNAAPFWARILARGELTAAGYEDRMRLFNGLGIENTVIGSMVIRRHTEQRPPITVRRLLARGGTIHPAFADWLFHWEELRRADGFHERLLQTKPSISPYAEIQLSHRASQGQLRAELCTAITTWPFLDSFDGPPSLALLFGRTDGSRTLAELRNELAAAGAVLGREPLEEFLDRVTRLIGGCILELEEIPLPPRPD
jgi:SAM-dependent methyltransferase